MGIEGQIHDRLKSAQLYQKSFIPACIAHCYKSSSRERAFSGVRSLLLLLREMLQLYILWRGADRARAELCARRWKALVTQPQEMARKTVAPDHSSGRVTHQAAVLPPRERGPGSLHQAAED